MEKVCPKNVAVIPATSSSILIDPVLPTAFILSVSPVLKGLGVAEPERLGGVLSTANTTLLSMH